MMDKRNSYPLTILFITVAVTAIMMGSLAGGMGAAYDPQEVLAASLGTGLACSVVGFVQGFHERYRLRRACRGAAVATLVGLIAGPLLLKPSSQVAGICAIQFVGSTLLIGMATIIWTMRRDPLWNDSAAEEANQRLREDAGE